MKRFFFSLILLFVVFNSRAQFSPIPTGTTEKYIEVKVTDTIMVDPDALTVMISPESEETKSYFDDDQTEEDARKKNNDLTQKKRLIEDILRKNNISFQFHEKKEKKDIFSKDLGLYDNAYEAEVKSQAQLDKLKKDLSSLKDVSTSVTGSKLNDKEKYELLLVDKVMKKAEREASAIAKAMGVTLDKPLNVSNQSVNDIYSSMFNSPESMGGMGAMFSLIGNMFKGATQQNAQVSVSKTLIVRYGIK